MISKIDDKVLRNFWLNEFDKMSEKLRSEAISPILNKVGQFLASQTMRNILGHPKSTVDLAKMMDEGKIVIVNLSQGKLGEDNSALLGAMVITKMQLAAMSRVYVTEEKRRDFYLYVDEFQNFATDAFIKILSEARKYRLNLTLANQYVGQIEEEVQNAIFGNVGSIISFGVGAQDSRLLAKEFGGVYEESELVGLGNYEIVSKLSIDNHTSRPFSAKTLPLLESQNHNRDKVIRSSRERYTKEVVPEAKVAIAEEVKKEDLKPHIPAPAPVVPLPRPQFDPKPMVNNPPSQQTRQGDTRRYEQNRPYQQQQRNNQGNPQSYVQRSGSYPPKQYQRETNYQQRPLPPRPPVPPVVTTSTPPSQSIVAPTAPPSVEKTPSPDTHAV